MHEFYKKGEHDLWTYVPEWGVTCLLKCMWPVKFFHCEKTSKFPSHLVHKKIDLKFSFHTYEVQIFRTPTLFCYTLEWHLKVLVFVSFFKDIDTKQQEDKCTFDAMYEKLLNMHLGNIHFKTYFSIVACGSKESGIQNFFRGSMSI